MALQLKSDIGYVISPTARIALDQLRSNEALIAFLQTANRKMEDFQDRDFRNMFFSPCYLLYQTKDKKEHNDFQDAMDKVHADSFGRGTIGNSTDLRFAVQHTVGNAVVIFFPRKQSNIFFPRQGEVQIKPISL
jgi:hypothetical protein